MQPKLIDILIFGFVPPEIVIKKMSSYLMIRFPLPLFFALHSKRLLITICK